MIDEFALKISPAAFRPVLAIAAGLAAVLASGCVSDPAPNSVRTTQTAPADLQLTCANAAAGSLGVDGSTVLPVGSSQLDEQKYQVELNAKGVRANCVIDTAGNVLSVQKI